MAQYPGVIRPDIKGIYPTAYQPTGIPEAVQSVFASKVQAKVMEEKLHKAEAERWQKDKIRLQDATKKAVEYGLTHHLTKEQFMGILPTFWAQSGAGAKTTETFANDEMARQMSEAIDSAGADWRAMEKKKAIAKGGRGGEKLYTRLNNLTTNERQIRESITKMEKGPSSMDIVMISSFLATISDPVAKEALRNKLRPGMKTEEGIGIMKEQLNEMKWEKNKILKMLYGETYTEPKAQPKPYSGVSPEMKKNADEIYGGH